MPIYEYKCKKCGAILEILHSSQEKRSYCIGDCVAEDAPGDGELERLISTPAKLTSARDIATGKVNYEDAAKKGFTTYKRRGKGEYERIAGNAGPKQLVDKD